MNKPKVGEIQNLYPAVIVSQNYYNVNPRSTIGTVTEISYYIRALFSILNFGVSESMFSSNNPQAYCPNCKGLGVENIVSEALMIPDRWKKLKDGAILYFKGALDSKEYRYLEALCNYYNIDMNKRVLELSDDELYKLLYSDEKIMHKIEYKTLGKRKRYNIFLRGAIADIMAKIGAVNRSDAFEAYSKYMESVPCHVCLGTKLKKRHLKI